MYMVCDGHIGAAAAEFVAANMLRILSSKLPIFSLLRSECPGVEVFAERVRRATCEAFAMVDDLLFEETKRSGESHGAEVCCMQPYALVPQITRRMSK